MRERIAYTCWTVLKIKALWLPFIFLLPLSFIWFELFCRLGVAALLVPAGVVLHEILHILFLPDGIPIEVERHTLFVRVHIDGYLSPIRSLFAALLPGMLLPLFGMLVYVVDPILALPLLVHMLSLPVDLHHWYVGVRDGDA